MLKISPSAAPASTPKAIVYVGIAATLLVLLGGTYQSFRDVRRVAENERWVSHTDSVMHALDVVLRDLSDAEAGYRGYVLTQDEAFLPPVHKAEAGLATTCDAIRGMLRDNAAQLERFEAARSIMDEKIHWMSDGIVEVKAGKVREVTAKIKSGHGRQQMDRLRKRVQDLQDVESALRTQRQAATETSFSTMLITMATTAVMGLVLLVLILAQSRRTLARQVRHAREQFEQRELLRTTLASIGDALILTDASGHVTYLNAVAESLTGWSTREASGKALDQVFVIVNETTRKPVPNPAMRALESGAIVGLANHTILIAKNGAEVHIDDSAAPIKNETGEVSGCVLIFRDIGEQRNAERALQEKDSLLRTALSAADQGSWALDVNTSKFRSDERYKAIFGTSVTGLTEQEAIGNIHPDDQARVQEAVTAAMDPSDPAPYSIEYRVIHADDSVHWVYAKGSSHYTDEAEGKKLIAFAGTVTDITERKQAEAELRTSEQFNRSLMDASPDCVKVLDTDGNLLLMNPPGMCVMEIDDFAPFKGKQWCSLWPDSTQEQVRQSVTRALAGEEAGFEAFCPTAKGTPRWWEVRVRPVRDQDGTVVRILSISRDITEKRKAGEDLLEADRRKDEFLAMLAHELRNPLAPIRNTIELLKAPTTSVAERESALTMMGRQTDQLVRMVDDLLDVSRVSQGKIVLRESVVDLLSVMRHSAESAKLAAASAAQALDVHEPTEPLHVQGDAARLKQVLDNLLNNAIKFTPQGGHIALRAERQNGDAVITVHDNGIGISEKEIRRVFDLFAQADSSLDRSTSGLGIGLTLAKNLVERQGGSIHAHSDGEGQGSTFTVRLPLTAAPTLAAPVAVQPLATAAKRKVLVVDDNRDAALSLTLLLSKSGHELRTAFDGIEGLSTAGTFKPDVVLLDIGLPNLNGYEVAKRIRREPWGQDMYLVALTGWGQDEDRMKSTHAGFDKHLVKPVDLAQLKTLLSGALDRSGVS